VLDDNFDYIMSAKCSGDFYLNVVLLATGHLESYRITLFSLDSNLILPLDFISKMYFYLNDCNYEFFRYF